MKFFIATLLHTLLCVVTVSAKDDGILQLIEEEPQQFQQPQQVSYFSGFDNVIGQSTNSRKAIMNSFFFFDLLISLHPVL